MKDTNGMNPRFVAYAASKGLTPEDALARDKKRYPGGCMCGFILWISRKQREFFQRHPECYIGPIISNQKAWDKFLGVPQCPDKLP